MYRKVLLAGVAGVLIVAVAGALWLSWRVQASVPAMDGEIRHAALAGPVTVRRDDWGVPHIQAEHEADAYFALGYVMAQDRLFQMEIMRRLAKGELAEVFGSRALEADKVLRTFRLRALAEAYFERNNGLHPELEAVAEAFCAGINHFQETGPKPWEFSLLRIPMKPFTPVDSLAVAAILPITFSYGPRQDPMFSILEEKYPDIDMNLLFPGYSQSIPVTIMETLDEAEAILQQETEAATADEPAEEAEVEAEEEDFAAVRAWVAGIHRIAEALGLHMGSNSWVVGPQHTASGGAILANDPHIGFTNPSIWYEAHMQYGDFQNYGYHLPAIPIALLGHNADRGWGLTMFANDDVDIYRETLHPEGIDQVMYRGEWTDLIIEEEIINVRFGKPVAHQVRSTPHGPLVTDILTRFMDYEGPDASLFWVWQHVEYTDLQSFYEMGHARDYQSFKQAVQGVTSPGVNISYADKFGNIAWWAAGKLPIRPPHVNSKRMLDGASGNDDILGYLPFEENPHLLNPASGFIATANNQPTLQPLGPIARVEGYWQPDDRARRITELLERGIENGAKWTLDDFQVMQMDDMVPTAGPFIDILADALRDADLTEREAEAWEMLRDWDRRTAVDRTGATIFFYFTDQLLEDLLLEVLGEELYFFYGTLGDAWNFLKYCIEDEACPFWNRPATPEAETRQERLVEVFRGTVARLERDLGSQAEEWTWGRVHTVTFTHPIGYVPFVGRFVNIGPFPTPGAADTVNNMLSPRGRFNYGVIGGPATRRLIDFAEPEYSYTILPTGNSGHLASPHYDDQAEMFVNGEYREVRFTEDQIGRHTVHTLELLPE